jgi:hypothetical protein
MVNTGVVVSVAFDGVIVAGVLTVGTTEVAVAITTFPEFDVSMSFGAFS